MPAPPTVPRSAAEWERVRAAKQDVLARDPFTVDPADYPDVRPEVVQSWRRSVLAGVDIATTGFPVDPDFQSGTRLAAVAEPIMNRLKDEVSDLSSWGVLADRGCRLLTAAIGDFPQVWQVRRQDLRPGMCLSEEIVGTNGLGCAHELQQPMLISGTEHFRDDTEVLTTTGVIIRDPLTKRFVGTFGVACRREYASAAMLPLVVEIGRSIEAQLLASRTDGEREFFDAFSSTQRRYRGAVVGVSTRLCVVNSSARDLVRDTDEELLRRLAEEANPAASEQTVHRRLSSGATVRIQIFPVPQPRGEFAAILVLRPARTDDTTGGTARGGGTETAAEFRARLSRALAAGAPVLLAGERGSGKRYEAHEALCGAVSPGSVTVLDGALAHLNPTQWLHRLLDAVHEPGRAVLLGHITELPAQLMSSVADVIAETDHPVVGTTTDGGDGRSAVLVRESFPVVLTVPPLRERREEFAQLCTALLAELAETDEGPTALTQHALAALVAGDWPGNIRQLYQVLLSARLHAAGPRIDVADLPTHYARNRSTGPLDEVQRAERRVLQAALHDAGGDRRVVAERLGISRATVYRKLKRYELH